MSGFRMPAEWVPHERTWMIWPCREEVWEGRFAATKAAYARVAEAIARFEPVAMIADPADAEEAAAACGEGIEIVPIPVDDSWARDSGPCFVTDGQELRAACFGFNAWGGKYEPYDRDAAMGARLAGHLGIRAEICRLIAEGGGISVDGEGTALTTESCFPNVNRNPGWSRGEIEAELKRMLGLTKVIWLPGDEDEIETDGHVDGIAVFAGPGRVIVEAPAGPGHPLADVMQANIDALAGQTDARGREIELIRIGDAASAETDNEDRFCRSYVNFYIANGAVVAPVYGVPEDAQAHAVLARAFPDREVVGVDICDIAPGGGGIHCITQQQPRV